MQFSDSNWAAWPSRELIAVLTLGALALAAVSHIHERDMARQRATAVRDEALTVRARLLAAEWAVDDRDAEGRGPLGVLHEGLDGIGEALALRVAEDDHAVPFGAAPLGNI